MIIVCLLAGHCREAYENILFIKKETQSKILLVLIRKLLSNQFTFLPGGGWLNRFQIQNDLLMDRFESMFLVS